MAGPATPPAPSRSLLVMAGLVLLVALFLLTRSWNASLLDRYEFRQLQTALTTHWIVQEGWRLDYLTPLFGPPWSVPKRALTFSTRTLCTPSALIPERSGFSSESSMRAFP